MATSTYLAQPKVEINSVDLQDQATSAVLTLNYEAQDASSFGSNSRSYVSGMANHELTVTLYMSYAASETYATLKDLVGTQTTVRVTPTNAVESATNPAFILTGTYLESLPVINASLGTLSTIDIVFRGGVYSTDTTNP
jgi:hypothetical protein